MQYEKNMGMTEGELAEMIAEDLHIAYQTDHKLKIYRSIREETAWKK